MTDHIPEWAGSRRGPQCLSGVERLRQIVCDGGWDDATTWLTMRQARELLALIERDSGHTPEVTPCA